jgi:biotin synthase
MFVPKSRNFKNYMNNSEMAGWLKENNPDKLGVLFKQADRTRKRYVGNAVHLRGIIEFSNYCCRDCLYCGLRKSNRALRRYRLSSKEIMSSARTAAELKIPTVVLQSGEDREFGLTKLCRIIRAIKRMGLAITLSLGELPEEDYRRLRDAGADRYLLKFETSDCRLYEKLRPGCKFADRVKCLESLRGLGYQAGSGNMIGLPGQSVRSIAKDISLFKELDLDMIGIGPFIPHPQTPLANTVEPCLEMVLKTVALTRLTVPRSHIPATTAAGTIDPYGREKALRCGGNVVMPNITPQKFRKFYEIYPSKICINEDAKDCFPCLARRIRSVGRTIARSRGDTLKR